MRIFSANLTSRGLKQNDKRKTIEVQRSNISNSCNVGLYCTLTPFMYSDLPKKPFVPLLGLSS